MKVFWGERECEGLICVVVFVWVEVGGTGIDWDGFDFVTNHFHLTSWNCVNSIKLYKFIIFQSFKWFIDDSYFQFFTFYFHWVVESIGGKWCFLSLSLSSLSSWGEKINKKFECVWCCFRIKSFNIANAKKRVSCSLFLCMRPNHNV